MDSAPGRKARTKGVSLSLAEQGLVDRFEELTGVGFTEQVRQGLLQRLPAVIALLEDMVNAGMDVTGRPVADRIVFAETAEERRALYEDSFEPVDAGQTTLAV
jgi:hypothetical protein